MKEEVLIIHHDALEKIKNHSIISYPFECCGAMLGKGREVNFIVELENVNKNNPQRRYQIKPEDFMMVEKIGKEKNLDFIGIYHSHPDHPAEPSSFDLENAWEGLSYLIISVVRGSPKEIKSFRLNSRGNAFEEEKIKISGGENG